MEVQNDPRFFQSNVIDKRLAALKSLTIVSSLMVGTSISQLFSLKKVWNFDAGGWCVAIGAAQIFAFTCQTSVAFMCLVSLYTMCQQLYHIYRLKTSGPTGVELAGEYYLHPTVVVWRHTGVKCLLNGLVLFVFASGCILFVKFIKDSGDLKECFGGVKEKEPSHIFSNATATIAPSAGFKHPIHIIIACLVWFAFACCAWMLYHIKSQHQTVFRQVYSKVHMLLPSTRAWSYQSYVENHEPSY